MYQASNGRARPTDGRRATGTDNGEEAGREAGDQVFAGSRAHDGVVSAGDGGAVIGRHHQAHFDEVAGVARQPGSQEMTLLPKPCQCLRFQMSASTTFLGNHNVKSRFVFFNY